jgi:hypothetical protein
VKGTKSSDSVRKLVCVRSLAAGNDFVTESTQPRKAVQQLLLCTQLQSSVQLEVLQIKAKAHSFVS